MLICMGQVIEYRRPMKDDQAALKSATLRLGFGLSAILFGIGLAVFAFAFIRNDGPGMAVAFSGYLITLFGCCCNLLAYRVVKPLLQNPVLRKRGERIRLLASIPMILIGAFVLLALYESLTI